MMIGVRTRAEAKSTHNSISLCSIFSSLGETIHGYKIRGPRAF
jgi:hypothetical protein